jgi:hypothetical protein
MPGNDLHLFREILIGIKRKPSENDQIEGDALLRAFLLKRQMTHI